MAQDRIGSSKSRQLAFVVIMSAMGNALAAVTIAPTLFRQIALDFSSLPVLIAAVFAGPKVALLTGLTAGLLPSIYFGFIGGQLGFLGFTTSLGKALQGLVTAYLVKGAWRSNRSTLTLLPVILIGFLPEALWIAVVFTVLSPLFLPSLAFLPTLAVPVIVKGTFEMVVMAFFVAALAGHRGFKSFAQSYLGASSFIARIGAKEQLNSRKTI